ncbi:hypothetical protein LHYA1_G006905 [Lachnellula hyalina]|uniref:Uncharacterized protein n=1 Tax=Lachnellula hyalina TaxID=1316788 RepID=A0A8H8QX96_9HELO|nr:uncharacterized protein LHYA1_G006905 [Lachnellula hyalina]TVY24523.1 hypothetical protein LHYA1_G006905 [Lachnellula hyalina]
MDWLLARAKSKRNRLLKRKTPSRTSSRAPSTTPSGHQKFDEATGQVYTETTTAIETANDLDWTRRTVLAIGPDWREQEEVALIEAWRASQNKGVDPEILGSYRGYLDNVRNSRIWGFRGARSLQDVAVEAIVQNITEITLEGMECLPVQLVRRIWHAVDKRCLISLDTWLIFSKLLHKEEESTLKLMRYRQDIAAPKAPLQVYTAPLISPSFDFITCLSITIVSKISDLVKISLMKNLGSLEIIHTRQNSATRSPVTDRLMRSWHQAAMDDGAFPVLRIMRLWSHPELTSKSLVYLNSFPAMAVYDVRWCAFDLDANFRLHAKNLGWVATLEPDVLGLMEAACLERAFRMRDDNAKSVEKAAAHQLRDGSSIRRIPRSKVRAFLTQSELPVAGDAVSERSVYARIQEDMGILEPQYPEKDTKDSRRKNRVSTGNIQVRPPLSKHRAAETWEFPLYTTFSKIGELRNDLDLKRAGVDIGDLVVVDNELVNSVPMVSLRLGPSKGWLQDFPYSSSKSTYSHSNASSSSVFESDDRPGGEKPEALAFIRVKAPEPGEKMKRVMSAGAILSPNGGHIGDAFEVWVDAKKRASSQSTTPVKANRDNFMKRKKRKIGDVLSSFL